MKARRLIIGAIWLNLVAVPATAETMVVRPDPCPAPADVPRIVFLDAEADDLNPHRAAAADSVLVLYPVPVAGWASARILARFDVEEPRGRIPSGRFCLRD